MTNLVTVMAPDYLRGVLDLAAAQFQKENRIGISALYVHPDSVILQARLNARVDLFIAGNPGAFGKPDRDTLFIKESYACPFRLTMVLIGRIDGPQAEKLDDLKRADFRRVVIVDPDAGYEGFLARDVLKRRHLWNKLQSRLILARSSEHLFSFLETGEADAGLVFESSMMNRKDLTVMQSLDKETGKKLIHCGMITAHSKNKDAAQAFLDLFDSNLCEVYKIHGVSQYQGR